LLRDGIPLASVLSLKPPLEYMAQVWRFTDSEAIRKVWPMSLREPLLPIPVPVRPEDADAVLDLQNMLNIAYDRAAYDLRVDYRQKPIPPLKGDAADWANDLLSTYPRQV
jgi:hypothetical protein